MMKNKEFVKRSKATDVNGDLAGDNALCLGWSWLYKRLYKRLFFNRESSIWYFQILGSLRSLCC